MTTFKPDKNLLASAMDRVLPAVDDLPGAGSMGLSQEVIDRSKSHGRFWEALHSVLSALPEAAEYSELDGGEQDAALSKVELQWPDAFGLWTDVVYTVYYMQPDVHRRIGWHGRAPQPEGNQMPPWDEEILKDIRHMEPFWRHVD